MAEPISWAHVEAHLVAGVTIVRQRNGRYLLELVGRMRDGRVFSMREWSWAGPGIPHDMLADVVAACADEVNTRLLTAYGSTIQIPGLE